MAKFDSNGKAIWTRQFGTTADDLALDVAVDAAGNGFLSAVTRGTIARQGRYADYDIALLKYDTAGSQLWARQEGDIGGDRGAGVAIDPAGNAFVACTLDRRLEDLRRGRHSDRPSGKRLQWPDRRSGF